MSDDLLELLSTAPAPPMSIDPYAAMATGRRNRARRRVVTSLVAAAAVVALAVGGWALADLRSHQAIPAGSKVERATLQVAGSDPTLPVPSIEVTASRTSGAATFTSIMAGRRVDLGTIEVPGLDAGRMQVSKPGTPPMLLVVLPRGINPPGATSVIPVSAVPDMLTYYNGTAVLPDTGRTVSVLGFPSREAALKVKALKWTDPVQGVRFTDDSAVFSARFPGPSGSTRQLFVDEQLHLVGLGSMPTKPGTIPGWSGDSDTTVLPASGIGLFGCGNGSFTDATGASTAVATRFGLLPAGATNVRLVDAAGKALALTVTTYPLPGTTYLFVYTEQQVAGTATPLIDALAAMTWTDAAGATQSTPCTPEG